MFVNNRVCEKRCENVANLALVTCQKQHALFFTTVDSWADGLNLSAKHEWRLFSSLILSQDCVTGDCDCVIVLQHDLFKTIK